MKQYLIDELRPSDHDKLETLLGARYGQPDLGGVYWVPIRPEHYSEMQAAHGDCQPFYFAVELQERWMACELLVRTRQRLRCDCIAYATQRQRDWLMRTIDGIIDELDIKT
jgi:hypothetical protein